MIKITGCHTISEYDNDETLIDCDNSQVSDGYHSIDELYDHRCLIFLNLCKALNDYSWKSKRHSDGSMFTDWFIAGIELRGIGQITYHVPIKYWNMSKDISEFDVAPPWDGHTSQVVLSRLESLLRQ